MINALDPDKERNVETHIKIIGWLHIALHLPLLLFSAIFLIAGTAFGSLFGSISHDPVTGLGFAGIFTFVAIFCLVIAIPGIITGYALITLKPWGRTCGIIASFLDLFSLGLGTALGVYGLVILFNEEAVSLFDGFRSY